MPSAGHVEAGEKIIEAAIRETKADDYEFICEYIFDKAYEIAQLYLLQLNLEVNEFKVEPEEVAEVKRLYLDDFEKLFYSDDYVEYDNNYRNLIIKKLKEKLTKIHQFK